MLQEYKTKTNIGVGLGLALQMVGNVIANSSEQADLILGLVAMLAGVAVFIWGCMSYARGKGQSPYLGVLGLLSILGLVILVVLPDKHKAA
jgi:uncharacterized membrane protein YhhN